MMGFKHINAYVEIIIYLLKKGTWQKTKNIQDYLTKTGVLDGNSPSSDRRLLSEYLKNLEYSGYIFSRYPEEELKGRKSQEWKINENAFKSIIGFTNSEIYAFLTSFNFLPDNYRTLPFYNELQNILRRLSYSFDERFERKAKNAFKYIPEFHEKFSKVNEKILNELYKAILEEKSILIEYENKDRLLKVFPIGMFVYNGLLYLKVIDISDKNLPYKLLKVDCINSVSEINLDKKIEKSVKIKANIYEKSSFKFDLERPFFFAFDIEKSQLGCSSLEKFKFIDTQFHIEQVDDKTLRVYAVGLTGWRFASRMLVPYVLKFYEPDKNIIKKAKKYKKEIKDKYTDISYSLKENKKRYEEFKDTYLTLLKERQEAI